MNRSYLHLILSQIPMIGTAFGLALFMPGYVQHNSQMQLFAFSTFLFLFGVTVLAYWSGYQAQKVLLRSSVSGHAISEKHIEKHALYAQFLLFAMTVLGGVSLAGVIVLAQGYPVSESLFFSTVGIGILNLVLMIYTADSGYKIRHPETTDVMTRHIIDHQPTPVPSVPVAFAEESGEIEEDALELRIREDKSRLMEILTSHRPAGRK
jgi:hypothetical protein